MGKWKGASPDQKRAMAQDLFKRIMESKNGDGPTSAKNMNAKNALEKNKANDTPQKVPEKLPPGKTPPSDANSQLPGSAKPGEKTLDLSSKMARNRPAQLPSNGRPRPERPSSSRPAQLPGNAKPRPSKDKIKPRPGGDKPAQLPGLATPGRRPQRFRPPGRGDKPVQLPGAAKPRPRPSLRPGGREPGVAQLPSFDNDRRAALLEKLRARKKRPQKPAQLPGAAKPNGVSAGRQRFMDELDRKKKGESRVI